MKRVAKALKTRNYILTKFLVFIILLAFCIVGCISYFKGNVLPLVITMSEATVKGLAINAINNAAHMVLDSEMNYADFVTITKDKDDNIQMIQANTVKINRLTRDLANLGQANVEKIGATTVTLQLGAFTGSVVLSDMGPDIEIPLLPIGTVVCDFSSVFEEVGINQTRHSIFININTTISLVLPVSSVPVNITTVILVCDNIIIGEVPEFYLNSGINGGNLDLSP